MIDLTKTELNEISRCLMHMIKGGVTGYSCLTIALNKRVRIMIENYDKQKSTLADLHHDE